MTWRISRLGWRKDRLDHRDVLYKPTLIKLPPSVDLHSKGPSVYDQGQLGSCTANAIAGAFDYARAKQGSPFLYPSRLFIYFNERVIEGTIGSDAGAELRDGLHTIGWQGVCPESEWAYDTSQFATQPPPAAYSAAVGERAYAYSSIDGTYLTALLDVLANGFPFVFGFNVFQSFMDLDPTSIPVVPLPGATDAPVGGHAVCAVGYDTAKKLFLCRNSWGMGWGTGWSDPTLYGHFWMPFDYMTNGDLASDFWQIDLTSRR